jgi:hypothetical protein
MARLRIASLILPLLALSACDETDAVSVRVRIHEDLSGTVTTSGLSVPSQETPIQVESQGAVWQSRVAVLCASGRFDQVASLKLSDLSFTSGEGGEGLCFVRVQLPRGDGAKWHRALVPLTADERHEARDALDPSGKSKDAGESIKIEIELPKNVVGNGLIGKTRGVKSSSDGAVATLLVPVETARTAGDSIVWHLTWQK